MTTSDIEASRVVQALAFAGPDDPTDPSTFPPEVTARQHRRISQFLTHDAPGSWVAVFLDDRKLADDAGEFDIAAGRHRLRVENPPLRFRREEWIAPRPGETITREFLPRP